MDTAVYKNYNDKRFTELLFSGGELGIKNEKKIEKARGIIVKGEIRKVFKSGQEFPVNLGWKDKLKYLSWNS